MAGTRSTRDPQTCCSSERVVVVVVVVGAVLMVGACGLCVGWCGAVVARGSALDGGSTSGGLQGRGQAVLWYRASRWACLPGLLRCGVRIAQAGGCHFGPKAVTCDTWRAW